MKKTLSLAACLLLFGCTLKTVKVTVYQSADGGQNGGVPTQQTMYLSDSSFESATDQASDGKLAFAQPGGVAGTGDQEQPQGNQETDIDNSSADVTTTTTTTTNNYTTTKGGDGDVIDLLGVDPSPKAPYQTMFHHTTTGYKDGGKSLVLCPGQEVIFDECTVGKTLIPLHGKDENRLIYWNMKEVPTGDIVCTIADKSYQFLANEPFVAGKCN